MTWRMLEVQPRSRSRRERRVGVPPALPRRKARHSHHQGLASLGRAGETPNATSFLFWFFSWRCLSLLS